MMTPESVIITVTNPHGGDVCIARARGIRGTGSSTSNPEFAADHLAARIYGPGRYTMTRHGAAWSWVARAKPAADVALCQQCAAKQGRSADWDSFHYGTRQPCAACGRDGLCAMIVNAPRETGAVAPSLHADVGTQKGDA
jgi:hypothetical protein